MRNSSMKLLSLLVTALGVVGCDDPTTSQVPPVAVEVAVTPTSATLMVGETRAFTATVVNATNTTVIWRSSAPHIASVSATGAVLGVTPGTATITAVSVQDTTKRASADVTVSQLAFRGIDIAPASVTIGVGQRITINATVLGIAPGILWRSSAPLVANVTGTGEVIGVGTGDAIITAIALADTTVRANAAVRVSSVPDTLPLLGVGVVTERFTAEVAVRGTWAYTSTWSSRNTNPGNVVKIWNVAANSPVLRDSLKIPGASTIGDVQISDDGALLVVAIESNPNGAILIYDLTNPARPDSIARFRSGNTLLGVHTVKLGRVAGRHYAFLSIDPSFTASNPARLTIVDITNPRAPVEVFSQAMGRPYVHDVFVRDGLLFTALWDDGLRIFDIGGGNRGGSPANPVVIGSLPTISGRIHNIWWFHDPTNNSRKYVFLGEEGPGSVAGNTASGDIHVIDITDMANPMQVAQYTLPGAGTHNFSMDEASGILYAAYYNGGVRALDVRGDLGSCTSVQRNVHGFCDLRAMGRERGVALANGGYIWGVAYQDSRVYASDMKQGLYVLDVSRLRR